jgi:hypothetical protein
MSSVGRSISCEGGLRYGAGTGDAEDRLFLLDRMGILNGCDMETSQLLCASRAAIVEANQGILVRKGSWCLPFEYYRQKLWLLSVGISLC